MKNLVATRETCEALKEAGFPQEAALEHIKYPGREMQVRPSGEHQVMSIHYEYLCAAPTLQEILKELPATLKNAGWLTLTHFTGGWSIGYKRPKILGRGLVINQIHVNPAEAAAQLWLKLQEATVTL